MQECEHQQQPSATKVEARNRCENTWIMRKRRERKRPTFSGMSVDSVWLVLLVRVLNSRLASELAPDPERLKLRS